ncbi:MAG: teicoplanin resistance protein VanZ [Acutalibacteraceae bacterium]|nr:teicoplanin resistance protein VanZ [Acutalibacteraceae bacterium]
MSGIVEWRKKENIKPIELPNKEKWYWDLLNIEHSWSGRMDVANIGNTFIMESEQMLINAIELFEMGYFDSAYYSLRSAVDISTTMVFLADMPTDEREKYLKSWKETKDFPMQRQMIKLLSAQGDVFVDMKEKMPDFFDFAKKLSAELNKYVHKQGLQHFYVSRNHPINTNKPLNVFIETFEYYLKKCIGVVAVMRLAIDAFPILLMDADILYRCFDSMTEAYSEEFVQEYIGDNYVAEYKNTEMYIGVYNSFLDEPLKNEATFNVMKFQYINTMEQNDILSQITLLKGTDVIATLIAFSSEKVIKVYSYSGIQIYSTDRESNRTSKNWSSLDIKTIEDNGISINNPYEEVFISVFQFGEDLYSVEHNEMIDEEEFNAIGDYVCSKAIEYLPIQSD